MATQYTIYLLILNKKSRKIVPHNPEVAGSNPASATKGQSLIFKACRLGISGFFFIRIMIFPINFPYIVHIASFEFMTKAAKFWAAAMSLALNIWEYTLSVVMLRHPLCKKCRFNKVIRHCRGCIPAPELTGVNPECRCCIGVTGSAGYSSNIRVIRNKDRCAYVTERVFFR